MSYTRSRANGLRRSSVASFAFALSIFSILGFFLPGTARSQSGPDQLVQVLLLPNSGNTLADDVVGYFKQSPATRGAPPVAALAVEGPISASYLLPIRASGDFLSYINANSQLERSKLERYVVVRYPPQANLQTDLAPEFRTPI